MRARRMEGRFEACTPAAATILGHPDVRVACEIRDISKSGMSIVVQEKVPPGAMVKVEWADHFLVGRVQRLATGAAGFVIGLELLHCSQWKEPWASALTGASAPV